MMSILTTSIQYNTGSINKVNQTRKEIESSHCGTVEMNPTNIHEDAGLIPGLAHWVRGFGISMSCGVSHRHSLDLALLWFWHRLAAVATI